MQRQYALGAASYVQLLTAQQQAQQNRINLIAAQTQRLVDSAALYQALGGGWVDVRTGLRNEPWWHSRFSEGAP